MERISDSTVRRLSTYLRALEEFAQEEKRLVSSQQLARRTGVTPAQVRKDLSQLGSLGRRGLGYMVDHLEHEIRGILGLSRHWRLALVGAGNMGSALASYKEFPRQGFDIVAVFDNSPDRIGHRLGRFTVEPMSRFGEICHVHAVEIGVIATPARDAQDVADVMVAAGLRGVLNFAPCKLRLPLHVTLRSVNMALELESLSFSLIHDEARPPRRGPAA